MEMSDGREDEPLQFDRILNLMQEEKEKEKRMSSSDLPSWGSLSFLNKAPMQGDVPSMNAFLPPLNDIFNDNNLQPQPQSGDSSASLLQQNDQLRLKISNLEEKVEDLERKNIEKDILIQKLESRILELGGAPPIPQFSPRRVEEDDFNTSSVYGAPVVSQQASSIDPFGNSNLLGVSTYNMNNERASSFDNEQQNQINFRLDDEELFANNGDDNTEEIAQDDDTEEMMDGVSENLNNVKPSEPQLNVFPAAVGASILAGPSAPPAPSNANSLFINSPKGALYPSLPSNPSPSSAESVIFNQQQAKDSEHSLQYPSMSIMNKSLLPPPPIPKKSHKTREDSVILQSAEAELNEMNNQQQQASPSEEDSNSNSNSSSGGAAPVHQKLTSGDMGQLAGQISFNASAVTLNTYNSASNNNNNAIQKNKKSVVVTNEDSKKKGKKTLKSIIKSSFMAKAPQNNVNMNPKIEQYPEELSQFLDIKTKPLDIMSLRWLLRSLQETDLIFKVFSLANAFFLYPLSKNIKYDIDWELIDAIFIQLNRTLSLHYGELKKNKETLFSTVESTLQSLNHIVENTKNPKFRKKLGGEDQFDSMGISASENYKNQYQIAALFCRVLFLRLTNQGRKAALDCFQIEKIIATQRLSKHVLIHKKLERILLHLFFLINDYFPQKDDGFCETISDHMKERTIEFYSVRQLQKKQQQILEIFKKNGVSISAPEKIFENFGSKNNLERQIALGEFDADVALFLGFFHEKRGKFVAAAEFFKLNLQLNSKSIISRIHLVNVLKQLKKYNECLDSLNSIVQIDDVVPAAYYERGLLCSRVFLHFDQAVLDLKTCAFLDTSSRNCSKELACLLSAAPFKQYDEALLCLNHAISLDRKKKDDELYLMRGNFYRCYFSNPKQADEDYLSALRINANSAEAYKGRGQLRLFGSLEDLSWAMEEFQKSLNVNPKDPETFFCRGLVFYKRKKYKKAAGDFSTALSFNSKSTLAHFYRGNCYFFKSKYTLAVNDYTEVIKLDNSFFEAYRRRGMAYGRLKDFVHAKADLDYALQLSPNNKAVLEEINLILAKELKKTKKNKK